MTLTEFERELLKNPFDLDIRFAYADALLEDERFSQANEQFELLSKQAGGSARPLIGLASCAHQQGDEERARELLAAAVDCDDFEADLLGELVTLREAESKAVLPFTVVDGGGGAAYEVVSLGQAREARFVDIVGMENTKKTLRLKIIEPFLRPGLFKRFKKRAGGGVLLYGPPGCGKTLLARAVATECNATFIGVTISDVLNMWTGESERNLSLLFERARQSTPAVIFFDELDALAFSRSKARSENTRTIVNEFLHQLDGVETDNEGVMVLAATNMPWDVDDAMKRPGRFDRQIFVPPPDAAARAEMFRTKLVDVPTRGIEYAALGKATHLASGADVDGFIDRAKDFVLDDIIQSGTERDLEMRDLLAAIEEAEPSTIAWLRTAKNLVKYGGADQSYKDVAKYLKKVRI